MLGATMVSCSLVVDTDECVTRADCEFDDGAGLECVDGECVATSQLRQALVPTVVDEDLSLSARQVWIVDGAVLIKSDVTLTIEAGARIERRRQAHLLVERGARLVLTEPRPDLTRHVIYEHPPEAQ